MNHRTLEDVAERLRQEGLRVELAEEDHQLLSGLHEELQEWLLRHRAAGPPSHAKTFTAEGIRKAIAGGRGPLYDPEQMRARGHKYALVTHTVARVVSATTHATLEEALTLIDERHYRVPLHTRAHHTTRLFQLLPSGRFRQLYRKERPADYRHIH